MDLKAQDENAERKAWLSLLARSKAEALEAHWQIAGLEPEHEVLRPPEIGAVMVRGRAGAVGAPFNLGEMTVTRASVRLKTGAIGHGYVQGRDRTHALRAALIDALMQTDEAPATRAAILDPLRADHDARARVRATRAAGTKVEFFTMERGHD